MVKSLETVTSELVRGVEHLRRADAQLMRRLAAQKAPNDTDRTAMRYIAAADDDAPATPGGLAGHLNVSTAAITSVIRRLRERGQIDVAAHPDDARSKILRPSARERLSTPDDLSARVAALASEFGPDEAETVARFLRRLAEEIDDLP